MQIQGLSQQAEVFDAGPLGHGLGRVPGIGIIVAMDDQLGEQDQVGPRVLGAGRPPVDGAQIFFRLAQQPVHGHGGYFECLHGTDPQWRAPGLRPRLTAAAASRGLVESRDGTRGLTLKNSCSRSTLHPGSDLGPPEVPSQVHGQREELVDLVQVLLGDFPPRPRGSNSRAVSGCGCPGSPS